MLKRREAKRKTEGSLGLTRPDPSLPHFSLGRYSRAFYYFAPNHQNKLIVNWISDKMNVHAVHFKGIRSLVRITNRCFFVNRVDNRFPPIRYICRFCSWAQRGPKITWRASLFPTEKEKRNAGAREHYSTSHIKRWRIRAHCVCHQTCLKENKFDYFFYESNLFILSSSHPTLSRWWDRAH